MDLLRALRRHVVKIKFTSLISGQEREKLFTLIGKPMYQRAASDKYVVFCVDSNEWEDLEKSTILEWEIVQ